MLLFFLLFSASLSHQFEFRRGGHVDREHLVNLSTTLLVLRKAEKKQGSAHLSSSSTSSSGAALPGTLPPTGEDEMEERSARPRWRSGRDAFTRSEVRLQHTVPTHLLHTYVL